MKSVMMLAVFIIMVNIIKAENEDLLKPTEVESHALDALNVSLTHLNNSISSNNTKKLVVTLKPLIKTPFVLPKRGEKKPFVPKFQLKQDTKENNDFFPISSTKRPLIMQTKKFTAKPHVIDQTEKLMERYNFNNKRTPSKFSQYKTEENMKKADKNEYKGQDFESRFQNFTNIDISSENSDESKEIRKPVPRRFMKAAASHRVTTTVTLPPVTSISTQRNYKIKDLLSNQKYFPRVERKKMPVLALQSDDGPSATSRKNGNISVEVDHKKSAFIRRKASTVSPDEDKREASETVADAKSR